MNNSGTLINTLLGILENTSSGIIEGIGTISQNATFTGVSGGVIAPGDNAGTLSVSGDINLGSNTYACEIDAAVTNNDVLAVSNQVTLTNATLEISWINNLTIPGTYTLMTFGSRVGQFASLTIPTVPGFSTSITYTGTTVTMSVVAIILPIELLYFQAEALDQSNKITWASSTESNTQYHVIERSINGTDDWATIGQTDAAGSSVEPTQYEFLDKSPTTIAYYRLRTIDFDGAMEVFKTIRVKREPNKLKELSVYPLPAIHEVFIDINQSNSNPIVLTLMDPSGRIIAIENYKAMRGTNLHRLDLSPFNAGMYFLHIDNGREQIVKRVLKL